MSKADKMREAIGDRAKQSIGARSGEAAAPPAPAEKNPRFDGVKKSKEFETIAIGRIFPDPDQPRKDFDEDQITEMADSLATEGQLQSISVEYDSVAKAFKILDGERRYRAALKAGLATLECKVESNPLDPKERLVRQVIANELREDLNDVELANALKITMEAYGLDQKQAAIRLRIKPVRASRALALLTLPEPVRARVESGELSASTAHKLTDLEDAADQVEMADRIVSEGLSRDRAAAEIGVLADRREEERAGAEGDPADESPAPAGDDAGGVAVAAPAKAKAKAGAKEAEKSKAKPGPKKGAKLKTTHQYQSGGYQFLVNRAKGIDHAGLLTALESFAEQIRMAVEDRAKRSNPPSPAAEGD